MIDVRQLFLGGLWLRRGAVISLAIAIVVLIKKDENWKNRLAKSMLWTFGIFIITTVGAGFLFFSDFNKYFTLFHEVFFSNDLWLLDPSTDLLIRMLPEGFFFDMVARIGIIFLVLMFATVIISIAVLARHSNKKN